MAALERGALRRSRQPLASATCRIATMDASQLLWSRMLMRKQVDGVNQVDGTAGELRCDWLCMQEVAHRCATGRKVRAECVHDLQ